jgi:HEAT repeat protein
MGFKEFLANRREKKRAQTIGTMTARLANAYGQTPERKRAILVLQDIDTDEALMGLLQRYKFNAEKSIVDEDEKEMIYEILLAKGPRVLPLLRAYLETETTIFWPLKLLRVIGGDELTVGILLELLADIPDDYVDTRMMDRKLSLISQLRDFQDPRILEILLGLVDDKEEEIRFYAVDAISTYPGPETTRLLVERLLDTEETARIRNYVMDLLVQNKWQVKTQRKELRASLSDAFWIDDTGIVQRKSR